MIERLIESGWSKDEAEKEVEQMLEESLNHGLRRRENGNEKAMQRP